MKRIFVVVLAVVLCSCKFNPIQQSSGPVPPQIVLFEGNNATQDVVCALDVPSNQTNGFVYDFPNDSRCQNDEARSLVLHNVPTGLKVYLYDDSSCTRSDSTTEILVQRFIESKVIGTFETELINNDVDVNILEGGNLDGKVSCVTVHY